jgi:hypothetical protein
MNICMSLLHRQADMTRDAAVASTGLRHRLGPSATLIGGPWGTGAARAGQCACAADRGRRRSTHRCLLHHPAHPSVLGMGWAGACVPMWECSITQRGRIPISARSEAHENWVPALGACTARALLRV